MTIRTPSGRTVTVTLGVVWHDRDRTPVVHYTGDETADVLVAFGNVLLPDPEPPPPPTTQELEAAAVEAVATRPILGEDHDALTAAVAALDKRVCALEAASKPSLPVP